MYKRYQLFIIIAFYCFFSSVLVYCNYNLKLHFIVIRWDTNLFIDRVLRSDNEYFMGFILGNEFNKFGSEDLIQANSYNGNIYIPDQVKSMTYIYNRHGVQEKTLNFNKVNAYPFLSRKPNYFACNMINDIWGNYYLSYLPINYIKPEFSNSIIILDNDLNYIGETNHLPKADIDSNSVKKIWGDIYKIGELRVVKYDAQPQERHQYQLDRNGNCIFRFDYSVESNREFIHIDNKLIDLTKENMKISENVIGVDDIFPIIKNGRAVALGGDPIRNDSLGNIYYISVDARGFYIHKFQKYTFSNYEYWNTTQTFPKLLEMSDGYLYAYVPEDTAIKQYDLINKKLIKTIKVKTIPEDITVINKRIYILKDGNIFLIKNGMWTPIKIAQFKLIFRIEKIKDKLLIYGFDNKGNEKRYIIDVDGNIVSQQVSGYKSIGRMSVAVRQNHIAEMVDKNTLGANWNQLSEDDVKQNIRLKYPADFYPQIEISFNKVIVRKFRLGSDEKVQNWRLLDYFGNKVYILLKTTMANEKISKLLIFNTNGDYEDEIVEKGWGNYYWINNDGKIFKAENRLGRIVVRKYHYIEIEEIPIALQKVIKHLTYKNYEGNMRKYTSSDFQNNDHELVKAIDILGLDYKQILLNEILARGEYRFNDKTWYEIFKYVKWYRPVGNNAVLSEIEKNNVEILRNE